MEPTAAPTVIGPTLTGVGPEKIPSTVRRAPRWVAHWRMAPGCFRHVEMEVTTADTDRDGANKIALADPPGQWTGTLHRVVSTNATNALRIVLQ
jgi:hypothetical protein